MIQALLSRLNKEEKATDREAGYALTESLIQISEALWEQKNTALIPDLETAVGLLKQSGTDEDTLKRFQRSLDALKAAKNAQLIPQNVRENPLVSAFLGFFTIVPLSLLFTWVLLLRLKPLWLLKIYYWLQAIRKEETPNAIKEGLSYLFLIRFFAYRPRVLDAWVAINLNKICKRFNQIEQVKNNSSHISTPPFVPENDEKFKEVFAPGLVRLLITGERGTEKTNLACWLVTQVMEEPFILGHPIIPIWIDDIPVGEANDRKNWLKLKTQAIIQELYEIPGISLDLSNTLLRERRILVVIDPISKNNSEDFKKLLQPENLEGINCLIVASRYRQICSQSQQ